MQQQIKSWLFVIIQLILLVLLVFFTNSSESVPVALKILGRIFEVIGLIILLISFYDLRKSLTALPTPKQNGQLQIKGLYAYFRHPMYVGVLLLSLGIAVYANSIPKYLIVLGLYLLFNFKARYEEKLLVKKYPEYKTYMSKTNRFIPKVTKS